MLGVEPAQVQERVENHLKSLLIKHFDPQKADSIFTVEGEVKDCFKVSVGFVVITSGLSVYIKQHL